MAEKELQVIVKAKELALHTMNPRLLEFYEFLEKMGYTMSTEESQLADGTSPLFKTEEE